MAVSSHRRTSGSWELRKIELGQTVTILANVGVLAGLLLLAFELNQNRQMMEAQTRHEMAQSIVEQLGEIASNADLANLEYRGRCGKLESEVEELRFFSHVNSRLRYWEDAHYQYRQGLYGESEFVTQKEAWRSYIQNSATRDAWNRMKGAFSLEFVAEMDALLADTDAAQFEIVSCS